jgi:hypothetical protein
MTGSSECPRSVNEYLTRNGLSLMISLSTIPFERLQQYHPDLGASRHRLGADAVSRYDDFDGVDGSRPLEPPEYRLLTVSRIGRR